jgi:hypothetical protein
MYHSNAVVAGSRTILGILSGCIVTLFCAAPASAFECTRSAKHNFVSLRWDGLNPIPYGIQKNPNQRTSPELLKSALEFGFAAWSKPECSSLSFEFKGEVDADVPVSQLNQIIIISEDWPGSTDDVVGLTTVTYNTQSGLIKYGKIELNEAEFEFVDVVEDDCSFSVQYDLHSVLTHEIGHFIGLAHLSLEDAEELFQMGEAPATMSRAVEACDAQFRSLQGDDTVGVCFVYPVGQNSRSCATLPAQETSFVVNDSFSCAAHRPHPPKHEPRTNSWVLLFLLVAVFTRQPRK